MGLLVFCCLEYRRGELVISPVALCSELGSFQKTLKS